MRTLLVTLALAACGDNLVLEAPTPDANAELPQCITEDVIADPVAYDQCRALHRASCRSLMHCGVERSELCDVDEKYRCLGATRTLPKEGFDACKLAALYTRCEFDSNEYEPLAFSTSSSEALVCLEWYMGGPL